MTYVNIHVYFVHTFMFVEIISKEDFLLQLAKPVVLFFNVCFVRLATEPEAVGMRQSAQRLWR